MPISRYEIRNEYSLADPELYRAADKDDPEAYLEGVAMAGLVGVLRQLGDLAEFAAEIFHNLHEDVMATSARGHVLAVRVQQLETEIPSIERAFLSQIDHSSFFYHPGVDWHPNLRPSKNLVQGDLPRFIMDSYEECRAPPRLFLLDKFDVAGAGACLKRYTDPSFFKVETAEVTSADIQREKKTRKTKKKGPRWRNRETHEILPTSHTKLHQLFLEERVENGVATTLHRAKLKRRLNGFPFNSKTGRSYMEDILKSPSPDHKALHDMTVESPPLKLAANYHKEYGSEIFEVRPVSPDRESGGRERSSPSPDREGVSLHPPVYDRDDSPIDDKIFESPSSHPMIASDDILSAVDKVTREKVVAVDGESNRKESLTRYGSDDMASEIDNFVDAPSMMESEMDKDSDLKMRSDNTSYIEMESLNEDSYEKHLHSRSSDSQSTLDSTMSDIRNNSSTKEMSSFSSDSPSISTEKNQSESFSSKGYQCTDIPVNETLGASSYQKNTDEDFPVDDHSGPDDACTETNTVTNQRSEFEHVTSALCINGSMPTLELSDTEEAEENCKLEAPGLDEMVDDREKKINSAVDPQLRCSPSTGISGSQSVDDISTSAHGEYLVNEPNGEGEICLSSVDDIHHHTAWSSVKTSSSLLHEDESDSEDMESGDDVASTKNIPNVLSTNGTVDTMDCVNLVPGKFEDEFPEVTETSLSDYPDAAHNSGNIEPNGDRLIDVSDDEEADVSTGSPNNLRCIMEASLSKGLEETSLANAHTLNFEDNYSNSSIVNQITLENLKLPNPANSPDRSMDGLDVREGDAIPEEDTTVNETSPLGIPEPLEVAGSQGTGISYHVSANDSEALGILLSTSEVLEEPTGTSDIVEMDGISLCSVSNVQEVIEITSFAHPEPADEQIKAESPDIASPMSVVSDDASLSKFVEEHNDCFEDSGIDQLENGKLDLVEKVGPAEATGSGFGTIGCIPVGDDHPKSELSGLVPNSHLDIEFDHSPEFAHASKTQSAIEQCGLDREQELFEENGHEDHVPDAPSLPLDSYTEEAVHDKIGLPPSDLNQFSLQHIEVSSELSPFSPINNLQMLDNDDDKEDSNPVSAFSPATAPSPPLISELSVLSNNEINAPRCLDYPLGSIFPPNNPFLEANQLNLSDLPPLPPLPPVQWRMGKLQHALPSAEEEMIRNEESRNEESRNEESFPQLISHTTPSDDVGSTLSTEPTQDGASLHSASTIDIISSSKEMKNSPTELATETTLEEQNLDNCSNLEAKTLHETIDHPPKIENKPEPLATPTLESVFTSSSAEDSAENGSQRVKLPRPRNPLVDDVSFLDKSKLRKVTERARPEIPKVEERDSLLQQIRTKSFNLRPAMASRPSIRARGPNTNLKVVAILEKANAIRQAFAGSDEDDDSWSE